VTRLPASAASLKDHVGRSRNGARYIRLGQGRNPITFLRQSAKRYRTPEVLEASEIQNLLQQLKSCFRLMVLLEATTGLRRSELFAIKWGDVDFSNLRLDVVRSIYWRHIGDCKTEASRKPLPLDERVAADLWLWKETTRYGGPDEWIFASPRTKGKYPFWPDAVLQKVIRPAALKAVIHKRIGWHISPLCRPPDYAGRTMDGEIKCLSLKKFEYIWRSCTRHSLVVIRDVVKRPAACH